MERDLLELPYAERRLIVVNDHVVQALQGADEGDGGAKWSWGVVTSVFAVGSIGAAGGLLALRAYEKWKARNQAEADDPLCLAITFAEAKHLRFGTGHPLRNVVYAADPVMSNGYHPIASFHQTLFESKVAEALRLLRCLGATEISMEYLEGFERAAGVDVAGSGNGLAEVGGHAGRTAKGHTSAKTTMKLAPTGPPFIASDLLWFHSEPLWMEVAHARLESGLTSFNVELAYKDDFGVNAKLKARIAKAGLELGGSFTEYRETIWKLSGSFSSS